jgi:tetratricopeptide (TPR) repeat protein
MKVIKKVVQTSLAVAIISSSSVFAQSLADAKKAIDAEQYQKANATLKSLASSQPSAETYFHLGNLYIRTDYPDSAKAAFTKALSVDAKSPLSYVGLGTLDLDAKNAAAAKANFDKAISQTSRKDNDPYIYIAKAYIAAPQPDYATAITYLEKAISIDEKDAEALLALGDAYRGQNKISEAFSAYRNAYDFNKNLLRAKIELGVINKRAQAWQESIDEFNKVLAINPNYGPAYRELAETYNAWAKSATDIKDYEARNKQALESYVKYMDMTDRSLESRLRYADFLILAKDYKTLETEAQQMAQQANTNPRIYRYLGYAAFENGNYPASIEAINNWMTKADKSRLIPLDYLYLGKAQLKSGNIGQAMPNFTLAVDMDSTLAEQMSVIGKELFGAKKYNEAAQVYELALKGPNPSLTDRFYIGYSHYFNYVVNVPDAEKPKFKSTLVRADSAFNNVNKAVPDYALAYVYRARVNRLLDDAQNPKGLAVPHFEKFVELQSAAPAEKQTAATKKDLVDAYNYLANYYSKDNVSKSKELLKKTLEIDPSNEYATAALKTLASQ